MGARVAFLAYWFFDNLVIISKLKLIKKDSDPLNKAAMFCWWVANVCNGLKAIITLQKVKREKRYILDLIRKNPEKSDDFKANLKTLESKKNLNIRLFLKSAGDFVTSSGGWGLTKLVGINLNDSQIGIAGLVSSSIASYEAFIAS